MIVAIQQPEHAPWIGYFNKMSQVDLFVHLDDVQFKKRYFENRNKIRTRDGTQWITVPVQTKGRYTQRINEVLIDEQSNWRRKYLTALSTHYGSAPGFATCFPWISEVIETHHERLVDLNLSLSRRLALALGIDTVTRLSSEIAKPECSGSDLILRLCLATGASVYISGPDGRNYLDFDAFKTRGIRVVYHDFIHPTYPQTNEPFISHMSALDFLFSGSNANLVYDCYRCVLDGAFSEHA